ncbi:hypothetical protein ACLKA6_007973 [Drosophila palustris]
MSSRGTKKEETISESKRDAKILDGCRQSTLAKILEAREVDSERKRRSENEKETNELGYGQSTGNIAEAVGTMESKQTVNWGTPLKVAASRLASWLTHFMPRPKETPLVTWLQLAGMGWPGKETVYRKPFWLPV